MLCVWLGSVCPFEAKSRVLLLKGLMVTITWSGYQPCFCGCIELGLISDLAMLLQLYYASGGKKSRITLDHDGLICWPVQREQIYLVMIFKCVTLWLPGLFIPLHSVFI